MCSVSKTRLNNYSLTIYVANEGAAYDGDL